MRNFHLDFTMDLVEFTKRKQAIIEKNVNMSTEQKIAYIEEKYHEKIWFKVPKILIAFAQDNCLEHLIRDPNHRVSEDEVCLCPICDRGVINMKAVYVYEAYIADKCKMKGHQSFNFYDEEVNDETVQNFRECYEYVVKPYIENLKYVPTLCKISAQYITNLRKGECNTNILPLPKLVNDMVSLTSLYKESIDPFINFHLHSVAWISKHKGMQPRKSSIHDSPHQRGLIPLINWYGSKMSLWKLFLTEEENWNSAGYQE